jgi:aminoglycoside 6'-N-acetyltransferase
VVPTLRDEGLTLRPLGDGDLDALVDVLALPGVAEWWGPPAPPEQTREDLLNEEDGGAFAIEVGGELAGWLGFSEETEPGYQVAALDIILAPDYQDRGLGPAALRVVARWLIAERGHHRLTIDPAAHNERAIRAYRKVGFRPVGVARQYELGADGEWHDNLLMDLLAGELG